MDRHFTLPVYALVYMTEYIYDLSDSLQKHSESVLAYHLWERMSSRECRIFRGADSSSYFSVRVFPGG